MDKKLEILLTTRDMTRKSLNSVRGRIQRLSKEVFSLRGAFAGAAAAAGMGYFIKRSLETADNIGKVADKLGISTAALQEYRFAASQAGVQQTALDMGIQRFTRRVAEAAQGQGELKGTLELYGIAVKDAQGNTRDTEDVLADLADVIANTESKSERLRIAFKAFDSEGVAMVNMLMKGSAGLEDMRREARDLGIVMDDKLIRASSDAHDELDKLGRVIGVNVTSAVVQLAPGISQLTEDINAWVKANQGLINQKIPEYFEATKNALKGVFDFFDDPGDAFRRFLNRWDDWGDKILKITRYVEDLDRKMQGLPLMREIFGGGRSGGHGAGGSFGPEHWETEPLPPLFSGGGRKGGAGGAKNLPEIEKNYASLASNILNYERRKAEEIGRLAMLEFQYREEAWQKTLDARKAYEAQAWEGIQAGYWAEHELMQDVEAGIKESQESISESTEQTFGEDLKNAVTGWASGFSGTLTDMLWETNVTFDNIARSFGKMLTQMLMQKMVVEPLLSFGFGMFGLSKGVVLDRPTIIPMAKGVGIASEYGQPEAVMPLARTRGGDLGVKAAGGINVEVNMINQGQPMTARQKGGPRFDGRKLIVDVILEDQRRRGPVTQGFMGMRP